MRTLPMAWVVMLLGLNMPLGTLAAEAPAQNSADAQAMAREDYYRGIADYFQVPQDTVLGLRGRILDEEIPVVLFIAREAHADVEAVMNWHAQKKSWSEIGTRYAVLPENYYFPLRFVAPPFGKVYAQYKRLPRERWREVDLSDEDIVNLVNLRFIVERYSVKSEEIVNRMGRGESLVQIHAWAHDAAQHPAPEKKPTRRRRY